jgi:hypothetical protein
MFCSQRVVHIFSAFLVVLLVFQMPVELGIMGQERGKRVLSKVGRPVEKKLKTKNEPLTPVGMTAFSKKVGMHY